MNVEFHFYTQILHTVTLKLFRSFSSPPLFHFFRTGFCFCVHWCIYRIALLLKVPYLCPPLTTLSVSPPPSSALRCVIYESACWPVNVSPSILCSTPSELIRLWRAICPPLKRRESANFSSSFSSSPAAITYGCLFFKGGLCCFQQRWGMVAGTKINLDNIAECYEEQKRRAEQAGWIFSGVVFTSLFPLCIF